MKNLIFLTFFLAAGSSLFAQKYRVSGSVENFENKSLAHANVFLMEVTDSTMVNGASADDSGNFQIAGVASGTYFIKASYFENESDLQRIDVNADIDIGSLRVGSDAQALSEVVVTLPRVERKADRLVFNIEHTALSDGDVWGVLKRTPSVMIINDKLTVSGSNSIGILINDRSVRLPQEDIISLLSGTSASNVEAIEVITNPPSKYSAEEGALINIRMKKNLIAGYNGAIYNRYVQGVFPKNTVGTDHFFKGKKTRFSINYSFADSKDLTKYTDITHFFEDDTIASIWTAEQDYTKWTQRHNAATFFDYDIDERNTLSFSTIHIWSPQVDRLYDSKTNIENTDGSLDSSFTTINESEERQLNTSYYLDYVHKLKKEGAEISMNSHYTYYDYDRGQSLDTDFFDSEGNPTGDNDFTTDSKQRISLYSVQGDYLARMGKTAQIEAGVRYAGTNSQNNLVQEGFDQNQPGIDATEVGKFTYDESIYATYASFSAKWGLWSIKSGLRAEYTETSGRLDADPEPNNKSYLEWFPSFSVQYTPQESHDFNLYYYRRINRPRYNSVNPFQVFQSNNSVIEGNPDLLPAIRHYIAAVYTYDQNYNVELYYRNQKNQLGQQVFQDNEADLLRFISANLVRDISFGTELSLNKDITTFWYSYFSLSYFHRENRFIDIESGQLVDNGLWTWSIRTNNGFTFLEDRSLMADLDFVYFSPILVGNSKQDAYSKLGITFRKTLWDNRASISVGVEDIFNQGDLFNTRQFLDQYNTSLARRENRLFTFGFRYKFGNVKIRDNKKSRRVDERSRL